MLFSLKKKKTCKKYKERIIFIARDKTKEYVINMRDRSVNVQSGRVIGL